MKAGDDSDPVSFRHSKYVSDKELGLTFGAFGEVYNITTGRQFHFVNYMSVDGAVKAFEALDGTDAVPLLEPQTKERCRVSGDDVG